MYLEGQLEITHYCRTADWLACNRSKSRLCAIRLEQRFQAPIAESFVRVMKDAREPQPDRAPMVRPATARSSPCEEYAFAREFFPQARRPAADRPAHFGSKAATRLFLLGRTPSHRPACGEGKPAPLALAFRECPTSIAVPTDYIGIEPWPQSL